MVCDKCQKKLGLYHSSESTLRHTNRWYCLVFAGKVITPDNWKSGARNTTESGGRAINENKALTSKKNRFSPYLKVETCKICKQKVHQMGSHYCQSCAYKKGICGMCGTKLLDTKNYAQSSV
ncbi:unnamed protein product [Medioppia subpectinata]|uniref:Cysteine-rich PDZ-binding protein n=1 Tax=Medioppia subpectinata TaxID=1979941 RepID=A0A7R9KEF7_9ACAR|nr:unnamed protein product [Medioppia subpectinata]CAG2101877.1 unnamed protein product [Medioppia subpectinata]